MVDVKICKVYAVIPGIKIVAYWLVIGRWPLRVFATTIRKVLFSFDICSFLPTFLVQALYYACYGHYVARLSFQ